MVVIGTGTAAATVAASCREAGWQVAIVDSRPFGGTCQLRGCDPKKVLVGASEIVDRARRMTGKGINACAAQIQWPELMRFKRTFTDPVPKQTEESFAKEGIAAFHEKHSGYKLLIEEGTDRILGAHLLGASSDELSNVFALAIRSGSPATALRETILAYPTRESNLSYMLQ